MQDHLIKPPCSPATQAQLLSPLYVPDCKEAKWLSLGLRGKPMRGPDRHSITPEAVPEPQAYALLSFLFLPRYSTVFPGMGGCPKSYEDARDVVFGCTFSTPSAVWAQAWGKRGFRWGTGAEQLCLAQGAMGGESLLGHTGKHRRNSASCGEVWEGSRLYDSNKNWSLCSQEVSPSHSWKTPHVPFGDLGPSIFLLSASVSPSGKRN